jgi:hypothetical protein
MQESASILSLQTKTMISIIDTLPLDDLKAVSRACSEAITRHEINRRDSIAFAAMPTWAKMSGFKMSYHSYYSDSCTMAIDFSFSDKKCAQFGIRRNLVALHNACVNIAIHYNILSITDSFTFSTLPEYSREFDRVIGFICGLLFPAEDVQKAVKELREYASIQHSLL